MNLKQYKKLKTVRVESLPEYLKVLGLLQPENINLLMADNRERFRKKFGKQDFCLTTDYRSWVWATAYQDELFFLFSGKRGTSIEVAYQRPYIQECIKIEDPKSLTCKAIAFALLLIADLKEV